MSIILFIIALVLVIGLGVIFLPLTFIYYLVTLKWKEGFKAFERWILKIAKSLDQLGNVLCSVPFKYIFLKKGVDWLEDEDLTVSYVIAIMKNEGKLSIVGRFLAWLLDFLDKDHLKKAIENQRKNDLKACNRIEK